MKTRSKVKIINIVQGMLSMLVIACGPEATDTDETIVIGAILPFSGEQAAVGLNIEHALSLAIADVNDAGGVNGRKLELVCRDSNSGSDKGYREAKALLYDEKVKYLIGPEENALATALVHDVKAQDVLNILPGYTAPSVLDSGNRGAWVRLAPMARTVGCAMANRAVFEGYKKAVTLVTPDDYHMLLATNFNSFFAQYDGESLGTLTVEPGKSSYDRELSIISEQHADLVVMLVHPRTGAVITEEWLLSGKKGAWFLSPTLQTDLFLKNIPFGALDGFSVFSPSMTQVDECAGHTEPDTLDSDNENEDAGVVDGGVGDDGFEFVYRGVQCQRKNFSRFTDHYSSVWKPNRPLPTSFFYYDAVVLLAMGLQRAAAAGDTSPRPSAIREHIRAVAEGSGRRVPWSELAPGFAALKAGKEIGYMGAATQYHFATRGGKNYGEAEHERIDTWKVENNEFVISDSMLLDCEFGTGLNDL